MGKYIIELKQGEMAYKTVDSKGTPMIQLLDPIPYTEPDMKQVKRDYDAFYEHGYEQGLSDAWEAARKIWEYNIDTLKAIFGEGVMRMDWFMKFTASEAIEKIRQYEQEKEEQIQVGDEVNLKCGVSPAIYMQGTNGSDEIYLLFNDGSCGIHGRDEIECKTGRHFPEIAAVLEKMKES